MPGQTVATGSKGWPLATTRSGHEVRHEEVEPAVLVVVVDVDAHRAPRAPRRVERHVRRETRLGERAVAAVLEEEVRGGVVGLEQVDAAVPVEVRGHDPQSLAALERDAGGGADLGEAAAVVSIERAPRAAQLVDRAERPVADHLAGKRGVGIDVEVVADEEVEVAVAVVVEERGARTPARRAQAGRRGHVGEGAVAVVVVEALAVEAGDVEVGPAVVVVIADGQAHAAHRSAQACARCHVGERPVSVVAVERVARHGPVGLRLQRVGHEIDVEQPVLVEVHEAAPTAHRLHEVPAAGCHARDFPPDAGGDGHVDEDRLRRRRVALRAGDEERGQRRAREGGPPSQRGRSLSPGLSTPGSPRWTRRLRSNSVKAARSRAASLARPAFVNARTSE